MVLSLGRLMTLAFLQVSRHNSCLFKALQLCRKALHAGKSVSCSHSFNWDQSVAFSWLRLGDIGDICGTLAGELADVDDFADNLSGIGIGERVSVLQAVSSQRDNARMSRVDWFFIEF